MPRAKTTKSAVSKPRKPKKNEAEFSFEEAIESTKSRRFGKKFFFIILIIVGLLILAYYKKGWFIAATVNGQPITSIDVYQRMSKLYKERTLTQMVNETILQQEATKKGVTVTPQQINDKVAEQEKQYGGAQSFEMLLAQQGISRDDFLRQTKLQLLVEKLYENDIKPSDDEIKKFMDDNASSPEATEPAKFKQMASDSVKQDKLSKVFSEKFQQLKKDAKVINF